MDLFNAVKLLLYIAFYVSFERYFLFVSEMTKKLQEEIDEFSDSYYLDLDLRDIKQVIALVCVCVRESYPLLSFCVP
jgi:hypothetical protein